MLRTVEATLRTVAGLAQGSVIAFDYVTTEVLASRSLYLRTVRAALRTGCEPLKFGIDSAPSVRDQLGAMLQACGLALIEHRTLGHETRGNRGLGGFVTVVVP